MESAPPPVGDGRLLVRCRLPSWQALEDHDCDVVDLHVALRELLHRRIHCLDNFSGRIRRPLADDGQRPLQNEGTLVSSVRFRYAVGKDDENVARIQCDCFTRLDLGRVDDTQ